MKNPKIKLLCKIGGLEVWEVDGLWVRKNLDEDFTNFGQHYRFKFIPKNELWIEKEVSEDEFNFYITHLLVERKMMENNMKYEDAI